jgi:hypothetical protein
VRDDRPLDLRAIATEVARAKCLALLHGDTA